MTATIIKYEDSQTSTEVMAYLQLYSMVRIMRVQYLRLDLQPFQQEERHLCSHNCCEQVLIISGLQKLNAGIKTELTTMDNSLYRQNLV